MFYPVLVVKQARRGQKELMKWLPIKVEIKTDWGRYAREVLDSVGFKILGASVILVLVLRELARICFGHGR